MRVAGRCGTPECRRAAARGERRRVRISAESFGYFLPRYGLRRFPGTRPDTRRVPWKRETPASAEDLAAHPVAVPAEEHVDGMRARDGDVAHQDSPDGCECLVDRLVHLRQAEREPDEPEAARLTVAPAMRRGRPDTVRGDPLRGDDLERRDVHRASDGAGEREDDGAPDRASPAATSPATPYRNGLSS